MSEDLPYKSEYAKSGRASCKGCKTNIPQDSLRIARMIQSPHFDGKMPQWYHFNCFFCKFKPPSADQISHFNDLRWDDQERIKDKLAGGYESKLKDSVDGASSNINTLNHEFSIEYAKSSRAKCRKCEEKIEKNDIRIAKMLEPNEPKKFASGLVPHWHHVKCFLDHRKELHATNLSAGEIPGFTGLSPDDQVMVSKSIGCKRSIATVKEEKEEDKSTASKSIDSTEEIKLKAQNEKYWKIRDKLFKTCSNQVLRELLEANNYSTTGGESKLLDRCADAFMFGTLEKCPECQDGRLEYSPEGYRCTGNVSGWTRCIYVTQTPKRKRWNIPQALKEGNEFLTKFKPHIKVRKFPASPVNPLKKETSVQEESEKPLTNKTIVIVGKLKSDKTSIRSKIVELGGSLSERVTKSCFCCLSSPGEVAKSSKKMQTVEKYTIPVVSEEYLDAIKNGDVDFLISKFAIAPWGGEKDTLDEKDSGGTTGQKRKLEKSGRDLSTKKKMTMKGGAVVDPASEKEDTCHVLNFQNDVYTAVLGLVDLQRGTNSYYKLQVLEHDIKKNQFYVFRAWGRVGTTVGGNKLENFNNREEAVFHFQDLFAEKTGNSWNNRKHFEKRPNKFYPLDIDYGQDDESLQSSTVPGSISKLSNPVKEFLKLIFDVEAMRHALIEFEIDLKKMPLGKLSRKQIERAYTCLGECQRYVTSGINGSKILDASNQFFTLIPHDFGLKKPPLLDKQDLIATKVKMLDNLLDIEIAYSLLKDSKGNDEKDPLDLHYESLKADIVSANYCHATRTNNTALVLLCEVALGNMYELTDAKHISKLPAGKHSCKGLGKTEPDPAEEIVLPDGVSVPLGVGKPSKTKSSSLLYNEYIVYDVSQINMKYLVSLKLNFDFGPLSLFHGV